MPGQRAVPVGDHAEPEALRAEDVERLRRAGHGLEHERVDERVHEFLRRERAAQLAEEDPDALEAERGEALGVVCLVGSRAVIRRFGSERVRDLLTRADDAALSERATEPR